MQRCFYDPQSCTTGDSCVAMLRTRFVRPLFAERVEFLNILNGLQRLLGRILEMETGRIGLPTCASSDERCSKILVSSNQFWTNKSGHTQLVK